MTEILKGLPRYEFPLDMKAEATSQFYLCSDVEKALGGWVSDHLPPKETEVLLRYNLGWDSPKTIVTTFEVCEVTEDEDGNPVDLLLPVDEDGESLEFDHDTEWAWAPIVVPATLGKWETVEHEPSPPKETA